ncbi:unnamed protein product [Phytophthora fragariaefolia]|uniref:Unnamed protein product n=1 Tax=Phytophthora fragariaefolia TaxID=1490495 RepID=A0A9W6UCM8_9STRA|nr:unnamed protein product [Phytophthora fragariaefolia]
MQLDCAAEPELEPRSAGQSPAAGCGDDPLLRDFLAFVDTFPADSDQLLDENATATEGPAVEFLEGDGNTCIGATPATAVVHAPASKEQRRREACRLKDRNKIPKLRAEVEQLTKVLADYENGRALQVHGSASSESSSLTTDKERQLMHIAQQKNELLVENAQLRKQFHRATAFATNLQQMLNNEHKLYVANSSYFVMLKPLTPPDCQRELSRSLNVIMPCYGVAKNINRSREICGWNEKRLTDRSDCHNLKSKLIRGKSARFVFNQTWEVFLDPFRTEKLFAPIMNVRCRLVQRVDDDNVLFCYDHAASRVLSEKTDLPSVSTMALVTRFSTDTGHLIITRGLRRGSVEVEDVLRSPSSERRREIWLETLTW